ncbi:Flap endonuclease gen-like [Thalictrum thalictroides]|uniref:Flap endonuclease gen-like n=1 Tax=Thalictrum thalictroides TaxID=46969 RepID=A0A7J6W3D3_THATH|nr:Flap endonuclease gen-like [Thalictrum thalictroides]
MGVKNLWDILESCKKTLPLHHLQNKRLCIDLSCWIVQLQSVCKTHACIKDKVYLRSLFHRLRALIALNCSLIFVTDGAIPAIKLSTYRRRLGSGSEGTRDDTNFRKVSQPRNMGSEFSCMIKEAKALGMALGIPCLNGIEEGEAQCALLNSESLCDGCFTMDSDVFLFGARTVYRDIDLGDGGHVVCYEMEDIERTLGFGRNSMITLALLLGSDYSRGVYGFGPETACQIVKSLGDHIVLQQVATEGLAFAKNTKGLKKQGEVRNFDASKDNSLIYKQKNSVNRHNSQKDDQFLKVIDAYLQPKCHSPDSEAVHRVLAHYPFQRTELQQFCSQFFDWTSEKTDEYILPKIAERDLRRFSNLRSPSSKIGVQIPLHEIPVTCPVSTIIKRRKVVGKECFEVAWREFDALKSSVVPADLIKCACPEKIVEFEERMQAKKKNHKPRSKKSEKTAVMDEIDLKLQCLLLDIESENNAMSTSSICQAAVLQKKVLPEVIDILSPSPIRACKTSKFQNTVDQQIDVIHLSDSETETSPEHLKKARELRLFLASMKADIS